jgi:hypothetical protein
LALTGCFRGGGRLFAAAAGGALVTAAVISATRPPPPRVVYVPESRPGYRWQPGYWMRDDERWIWVEGRWIADYPGYRWVPTHWVEDPDRQWRLEQGHWMATGPMSEPPPPPPG